MGYLEILCPRLHLLVMLSVFTHNWLISTWARGQSFYWPNTLKKQVRLNIQHIRNRSMGQKLWASLDALNLHKIFSPLSSWWATWQEGGSHGAGEVAESLHLVHNHEKEVGRGRERTLIRNGMGFWNLKPNISDTSLINSHLLILPKQFHQLGTKYSKIKTYGSNSHSSEFLIHLSDLW